MRKAIVPVALLFLGIGVSAGFLISVSAEEGLIPSWIKTTAGFWIDDQITDSEFIAALQFLIKEGVLVIPEEETKTEQKSTFDYDKLRPTRADWVFVNAYALNEDEVDVRVNFFEGDPIKENYVAVDGYVKLRIVNDYEETVYTGTFTMTEGDFGWYTYPLTGDKKLEYSIIIPVEEIMKSSSSGGTIYAIVETRDFDFGEAFSQNWKLPTFSDVELEQEYFKNSILINKKISKGSFEVTVNKVGFFKQSEFLGEIEEYFRVDMAIQNISNEKQRLSLVDLVILDENNKQYDDYSLGGTLNTYSDLYPGVTIDGYELFNKIPNDTKKIRILFDLGTDSNYNPYSYEFIVDLG